MELTLFKAWLISEYNKIIICFSDEIDSSVVDSSDEFDYMGIQNEPSGFGNSYDISSSSLIKSPLISELLRSHGLLTMAENGLSDEKAMSDSESKVNIIKYLNFSVYWRFEVLFIFQSIFK